MAFYAARSRANWFATLRFEIAEERPCSRAAESRDISLVRPLTWRLFGLKVGFVFVPAKATRLAAVAHGLSDLPEIVSSTFLWMPRGIAGVGVCLQNLDAFRRSFQTSAGTRISRLRKAAAVAAYLGQEVPRSYRLWVAFFDTWPAPRLDRLKAAFRTDGAPAISVLVFCAGKGSSPALKATLASIRSQAYPPSVIATETGDGKGIAAAAKGGEYLAVLQAGEIVPRHGLLLMAENLRDFPQADILMADEDRIASNGTRYGPLFKPQPNLTMMCSGVLSRGLWVIRRELLIAGFSPWAECARLDAWFRVHAAGRAGNVRRIPYVLTHRRSDVENSPPERLAAVVDAGLQSARLQAAVSPGFPLRLRWMAGNADARKVSIIVPSRLAGKVQLSCLLDVLEKTTYSNLEMLVVVTQEAPLSPVQEAGVRLLRADPRVRVEVLRRPAFNYSLANNIAASLTDGECICLLNDDVSTIAGDWLDQMVGFFSDPEVGVVGAKLYYPNSTTQHGGIIMGLAGLADHANRFLPRGESGYAWRGEVDQELSAVTGACLLVRRDVYNLVDGLDEDFPTSFNDVDFCLRVRRSGYNVVFAASVELFHHETLSFGSHYGSNPAQELVDIRRMQERWQDVCQTDPFHNPNLSLDKQSEWQLAFPPRHLKDGL